MKPRCLTLVRVYSVIRDIPAYLTQCVDTVDGRTRDESFLLPSMTQNRRSHKTQGPPLARPINSLFEAGVRTCG